MTTDEIFNYVMDDPEDTNPNVLKSLLSNISGGGGGESEVVGTIEAPVWEISPCVLSGVSVGNNVYEADFDAMWEATSSSFRVTLTNGLFHDVHDEEGEGPTSKTYIASLNSKYTMKLGDRSEYDYVDVLVYDSPVPLLLPDLEYIQSVSYGMGVVFMRTRAEGKDSITNLFVNSNDAYARGPNVDIYILWNNSTQTAALSEESASLLANIMNFYESLEYSFDECFFFAHTDAYDVPGWFLPLNINETDGRVSSFSAERHYDSWTENTYITPVRDENEIVTGFTVSIDRYEQEI